MIKRLAASLPRYWRHALAGVLVLALAAPLVFYIVPSLATTSANHTAEIAELTATARRLDRVEKELQAVQNALLLPNVQANTARAQSLEARLAADEAQIVAILASIAALAKQITGLQQRPAPRDPDPTPTPFCVHTPIPRANFPACR